MQMTDSEVLAQQLARVALGDQAAFRRVYELTSRHLFGIALRILNRRDAAEDVLQDTYLSVWHHASRYTASTSQPMTWLISIVRNKALDVVRSAAVRRETALSKNEEGNDEEIEDERRDPLELLMQASESLTIRGCMESLDVAQRQSLALAYYHGLSHTEVAEQVQAPLGTVKSWVRRGLERLKRCLESKE
ncbi:MAG: sigma-70 family RNA polymerase sigma factor [Propionivibrio sp.]|nr:sigma-70 family RNA polymerase sigma factor [Propionivibrio sp.]